MRIRELQLLRYGHFEDQCLAFPTAGHDIHVVYGENEAGKSTALQALGDVLFEIPERTTMGFRHGMPKLRVGAVLESGKDVFEFLRRKGRRDTIIDVDGNPIADGEKTLKRFLNAADREFFERMFLLNHTRLEEGSNALLAGADAGEAMLASAAGLERLHPVLEALKSEQGDLWSPGRSTKRAYSIAKAALDAATQAKRDATVEPRAWRKADKAVADAVALHGELQGAIREKRIELERLERFRRLHGDLSRLDEAEVELEKLGDPALLPENAVETLRNAQTELRMIQSKIDVQVGQVDKLHQGIAGLAIEKPFLSMSDEIAALDESRVQLSKHKTDIASKKERRRALEKQANTLATELGWDVEGDAIRERLPKSTTIERARQLVTRHATLKTERDAAATTQRRLTAEYQRLEEAIKALPSSVDLGPLRAAVVTGRERRETVVERRRLEGELQKAERALAIALAGLKPGVDDKEALVKAALPGRGAVNTLRDSIRESQTRRRELNEAQRKCARRVDQLRAEVETDQEALGTMSDEDLAKARASRDAAWALLAARYIRGETPDAAQWTAVFGDARGDATYTELVADADAGADDRFTNASKVGAIANKQESLLALVKEMSELDDDIKATEADTGTLMDEWGTIWSGSPIVPNDPDVGLTWLDQAIASKDALRARAEILAALTNAQTQEAAFATTLLDELARFESRVPKAVGQDLEALIALAEQTGERIKQSNEKGDAEKERLGELAGALSTAKDELSDKDAAMVSWGKDWQGVLGELHLGKEATPDTLGAHLALIADLKTCIDTMETNVTARINSMQADLDEYQIRATHIGEKLAVSENFESVDEMVKALVQRLKDTSANQAQKDKDEKAVKELESGTNTLRADQESYLDTIASLAEAGGVKDAALEAAAAASDRRRQLEKSINALIDAIEKNGDKKTLKELRKESEGGDLDTATATIHEIKDELAELESALDQKRDELTEARQVLAAIGEEGEAARAESQRQQALADLERIAERFVRVASASALLQWSVDQFRQRNQKPLLNRASELFALITGGSFEKVVIDYVNDVPVLAGRRPDGEVTPLTGMSSGSSDQLYLAIRLASIEDYASKTSSMPFVGDDLFIRHDKRRTRQALNALTELSRSCQVILFSHDEAFVALAKDALPAKSNFVNLASGA